MSSIEQDLISSYASLETTGLVGTPPPGKRKREKLIQDKYGSCTTTTITSHENSEQKNMAHRDVERQRRQEMAKLYASLRSLLPLEYVKGKRSICDHMNESVNYIKQLQKNIMELSIKRDKLKTTFNSVANNTKATGGSESCSSDRVTVSMCSGGVEIFINQGVEDKGFHVSRVLEILVEDGLDVVSCVSTHINKKLLHVIKSEVCDPTCVDLSILEEKLADIINGKLELRTNDLTL
ncbi:hypothetical protein Vadar_025741 [Vaccinium darrowii]|uniref:Uncharacterized protein n=1 Tax=Vaccinium darrowii TaxID=229202 RepID=A0ACB7YPG0_9ERIC|nr:hypothetical protein Vadar_025741 [Vaccinium darrowii]